MSGDFNIELKIHKEEATNTTHGRHSLVLTIAGSLFRKRLEEAKRGCGLAFQSKLN